MWKKSISLYTYILLVFLLLFSNFNIKRWENLSVITWDIVGYYAYLPATFIHHDYRLNFVNENLQFAEQHKFWPLVTPEGNYIIKTTMGMSMMYAPFFFLAHIQSQLENSNANGFSWYYHKYVHLSCLFYLFIGLFFLRKLLLSWFDEWPVALTLVSIILGTNLFYFASTEAAMTHAYNFSLAAIFMYCVHNWFLHAKIKYAVVLGICLGLLILIRPINGIFILFPIFYAVQKSSDILKNIQLILSNPKHLILAMSACFLIILPQLIYWKSITGQYLFFSYVGERFFFERPKIFHGLFSFRNGWLIYSPLMIFSLIGMYRLYKEKNVLYFTIPLIFCIYLYLVFSWWCWWYVGFGNRAMIDLYSLLAIPMAAFFAWALNSISWKRNLLVGLTVVLIGLNLFQTLQYRRALIHFDSMNFKAYKASFGKLKFTDAYKDALVKPDYEKAIKGE